MEKKDAKTIKGNNPTTIQNTIICEVKSKVELKIKPIHKMIQELEQLTRLQQLMIEKSI